MKSARDPAPALARGLEILRRLSGEAPLSLEELTARLGYPKASVFRLLATLQNLGLVRRRKDKRYEPLWVLRPLQAPDDDLRQRLLDRLPALAGELQATVEWYEASSSGMVLMRQEIPEAELRVQARPGFLRPWDGEAEAVMLLGRAFHPDVPALPAELPAYVGDGRWGALPAAALEKQIETARQGAYADPFFNENSVRRAAVAVTAGNTLLGVLAVAVIYRFHQTLDTPALAARLRAFTKELP